MSGDAAPPAVAAAHPDAAGADAEQPADVPMKVTNEQLGIDPALRAPEGVELDLGNLMAYDPSAPATRDEAEAKAQATALTQALMNALLQLPSESTPVGRVAALPPPSTPLPRAKPLPKPREPTKWEKFAQQKGIVKRKRSALVFDENEQGFKRRYGYQRANEGLPIMEAKAGDEVGADPFTEEKAQKRERVKRNKASQLANLSGCSAKRGGAPPGVPASVQLASSLPEHGRGRPTKRKDMQPMIASAAARAGKSTASMGRFDKQPAGVKPTKAGRGQKAPPVATNTGSERSAQKAFAERLIRERG